MLRKRGRIGGVAKRVWQLGKDELAERVARSRANASSVLSERREEFDRLAVVRCVAGALELQRVGVQRIVKRRIGEDDDARSPCPN